MAKKGEGWKKCLVAKQKKKKTKVLFCVESFIVPFVGFVTFLREPKLANQWCMVRLHGWETVIYRSSPTVNTFYRLVT
jgi:hypothetical protein